MLKPWQSSMSVLLAQRGRSSSAGEEAAQRYRDNLSPATASGRSCILPYQQTEQISKPPSPFNSFSHRPLHFPLPATAPCLRHASALHRTGEAELSLDRTAAKPLHPHRPPWGEKTYLCTRGEEAKISLKLQEVSITARVGTRDFPALGLTSSPASPHSTNNRLQTPAGRGINRGEEENKKSSIGEKH